MERLTYRDRKGCAYFNDDGSLIRGANGTFHQKKDMTGQFIHQRFVALDKAIDRLAAYEDTGFEPEEIMVLIAPPNPPLTLEELQEMDGEPVYIVDSERPDNSGWEICNSLLTDPWNNCDNVAAYGKTWLAYRRKPEEESR